MRKREIASHHNNVQQQIPFFIFYDIKLLAIIISLSFVYYTPSLKDGVVTDKNHRIRTIDINRYEPSLWCRKLLIIVTPKIVSINDDKQLFSRKNK